MLKFIGFIFACTTIGVAMASYGQMERHQYTASTPITTFVVLAVYIILCVIGAMAWNNTLPRRFNLIAAGALLCRFGAVALFFAVFVVPVLFGSLFGQGLAWVILTYGKNTGF